MFNLCKLIIMYSRAASNRVGWVGSFSPAKGPFVFFPPSRPGCSLAILGFAIGLVRGCHDFPSRQCREKDDRVSLAFRIWLCLIYLFSPYSLWGILRLRTLEYIILQSSLGNKKATGRQRRPPARRPRRFVRATAFFMLHTKGAAWSHNSKPPANRQFSSAI